MPYIGVRVNYKERRITIKFHGPLDVIPLWPNELKAEARTFIENKDIEDPGIDVRGMVDGLAQHLRDKYCDGHDLLWVDVQLLNNDLIYGSTAERVLVS